MTMSFGSSAIIVPTPIASWPMYKMTEAADLAHAVNLGALLLETAAENHLVEHFAEKLLVGLLDRLELGFMAFLILGLC